MEFCIFFPILIVINFWQQLIKIITIFLWILINFWWIINFWKNTRNVETNYVPLCINHKKMCMNSFIFKGFCMNHIKICMNHTHFVFIIYTNVWASSALDTFVSNTFKDRLHRISFDRKEKMKRKNWFICLVTPNQIEYLIKRVNN